MKKLYRRIVNILIIFVFLGTNFVPISEGLIGNKVQSNIQPSLSNDLLFDRYVKFLMKMGHMPSLAVCCIKDDKVVFSKAYGVYDMENNKIATENTIYKIYSVSKTVTATAMMQLIENESYGINLDDNVSKYLPFDLKNPNYPEINITFRMLLTHHSSLNLDPYFAQSVPGDVDVPYLTETLIREHLLPNGSLYAPDVWSKDRPGEAMHYSNIGYGVVGYLVERISGQPFEEYCKQHIFIPLGMYNTSFRLGDLDISRVAVPYEYFRGEFHRMLQAGCIPRACGNLRTTIDDFSHFLIAHMNGGEYNGVRILKEETVEQMHTIQYHDPKVKGPNSAYYFQTGLGFEIYDDFPLTQGHIIGHNGGCQARMWFRPSDSTGVILFTHVVSMSWATWDQSFNSKALSWINALANSLVQNVLFRKASKL